MHRFTVDYSKDRPDSRVLMNRGLFLHGLPRLILLCRIKGHRPVVDGYDSKYGPIEERRNRWVICGRCGIRPEPQGHLDPDHWQLGQAYTGEFSVRKPVSPIVAKQLARKGLTPADTGRPGGWPARPDSAVGAQVIIGRSGFLSAGLKVGSISSEQCLAANLSLGPLGAVYVHTEDHGRFIQRLLNGGKDLSSQSREIGISIWSGRVEWKLWATRDSSSRDDPWWMRGSIHIDPRHYILGSRTCVTEKLTAKTPATLTLQDGLSYLVRLRLERWTYGRRRGKKTERYEVTWDCQVGIPIRFDSSNYGSSVTVSGNGRENGQWVQEAAAAIAANIDATRTRNNYEAAETS